MVLILPVLITCTIGALAILYTLRHQALPKRGIFVAAMAFPVGCSIASLFIFFTYLVHPTSGFLISSILLFMLVIFWSTHLLLLKKSSLQPPSHLSPSSSSALFKAILFLLFLIWIFAFIRFFFTYERLALKNIYGGWDALFFWGIKAKLLFRDASEWKNIFLPSIGLTHPHYPLLLPCSVAWGWLLQGREITLWPPAVSILFLISFLMILFWYLWNFVHPFCGLLGSALAMSAYCFIMWSTAQYADVPLAFFLTTAVIALTVAIKSSQPQIMSLCGWMAGCSAWTKNEGILFVLFLTLTMLIYLKINSFPIRKTTFSFLRGLAIPILAVLILKLFLTPNHGEYLNADNSSRNYLELFFGSPQKTWYILQGFFVFMLDFKQWSGLWIFFGITVLLTLFTRSWERNFISPSGPIVGLMLLGYFSVLHISPHDTAWQIQTTLHRLLTHIAGPALIFTFEYWGKRLPPPPR